MQNLIMSSALVQRSGSLSSSSQPSPNPGGSNSSSQPSPNPRHLDKLAFHMLSKKQQIELKYDEIIAIKCRIEAGPKYKKSVARKATPSAADTVHPHIFHNSSSSSQSSLDPQPHTSPLPPPPCISMNSSGPSVGAVQADEQVQAPDASQNESCVVALRLMALDQQVQNPISEMLPGVPNHRMSMENVTFEENSGHVQNQQPHQSSQPLPNPHLGLRQPSQIVSGPNSIANSIGNSTIIPPEVMPNPGPSITSMQRQQALQQLLQALRSPSSEQRQQQILAVLRDNPELINVYVNRNIAQKLLQPSENLGEPDSVTNSTENSTMSNPGPLVASMEEHDQAYQELLQGISNPLNQLQQHVLDILILRPQLLANFIRRRNKIIRRQQQQLQQQQQRQRQLQQLRRLRQQQKLLSPLMGG